MRDVDGLVRSRPFAAGAFRFVVEANERADLVMIEALFQDLPSAASDAPSACFSVRRADDRGWSLDGPRLEGRSATTREEALKYLVTAVNLCTLDAEPGDLHLHAAAATKDGRAVVIVAPRDVGKTTTIAHLVARGFEFVTDETVRLSLGTEEVTGVPKPLSIKPGGDGLVPHLASCMIPTALSEVDGFRFVPVGASGASLSRGGGPHLLAFLRRGELGGGGSDPTMLPLHPADAAVALMQETLDAARFGAGAAARLSALAAASDCYEVLLGSPERTADALEAAWTRESVTRSQVRVLPPSDAFRPGVVSLVVGGRAVVHDTESGHIFALDDGGTRVWSRLGGWSDDDIDVDGPVIAPFVAQLRALGVLAGST